MKLEYWPEYDMLSIVLSTSVHGHDADDPDIVLHFDEDERLAEIEISNASARVNLDLLRVLPFFAERGIEDSEEYIPLTSEDPQFRSDQAKLPANSKRRIPLAKVNRGSGKQKAGHETGNG